MKLHGNNLQFSFLFPLSTKDGSGDAIKFLCAPYADAVVISFTSCFLFSLPCRYRFWLTTDVHPLNIYKHNASLLRNF
jgi:hypothetical protein